MFLSLGIILTLGVIGGYVFERIHMPKLVFYLLLGICLGPSVLNICDESLLNISSYIRQIALVIILTRSGLSLDIKTLKKIGRPAIMMCFIPALAEIIGIAIFGPLFFDINIYEALLLGSVLAAVSPAVVVPRMIKLHENGLGSKRHVPELVMAGSSCDDIFVIILFYSFKGVVASESFDYSFLYQIPLSIILGLSLGAVFAFILIFLFKHIKTNSIIKVVMLLGTSFLMLGIENLLKPYVAISSLLGIILVGILILHFASDDARQIQSSYNGMWSLFEILLFTLVGCLVDLNYAFSSSGLIIVGLLFIGLIFRTIGVMICLIKTEYNIKERIFIVISYLPKATVQASIGGIALAENLACGTLVLTAAVVAILITAPLGAIFMDSLDKKLLKFDELEPHTR